MADRIRRSSSILAAAVLGLLVVVSALAAIPAHAALHHRRARTRGHPARCRNADATVAHASNPTLRAAVLCLINRARVRRGLPPLRPSTRLIASAQSWTDTMVATDVFTHSSNFVARVTATGFQWSQLGENIATGYFTPRQVVSAWMASQPHCQNILSPVYSYLGTGVNRSPVAGWATRGGTWTEDFGLKLGARAPSSNWGPADRCPH